MRGLNFFYLEPFDFTKSPSISIRGYGGKASDGWKLSSSNINGKLESSSGFSPYSLLFRRHSTLEGVKEFVENETYSVKDIIKDAKDADDKDVSLDQFWASNIGIKKLKLALCILHMFIYSFILFLL